MMFRTRSRWVIAGGLVLGIATAPVSGDVLWSGLGVNSNWTNPQNWQGGSAPLNDGTEQIVFDTAQRTVVFVDVSQSIRRLRFDFSSLTNPSYSLVGAATTLTLGGDGLEVQSLGTVTFGSTLGLVLSTAQNWTVDSGSAAHVAGTVSGSGQLTVDGSGYVGLSGSNTYTGGTVLQSGALGIDNNSALGTGPLTVAGPAEIFSNLSARTVANAINLNSNLLDLFPYGGDFRFTGPVTLGASTTVRNFARPVEFAGAIGETGGAQALTFMGFGVVRLSGANTYSGGTAALSGMLFFANATAVPPTGALSSSLQGYMGIAFNTGVQGGFVSKFSPVNTFGTLGFDSATGATAAAVFAEPIDLSAFNAFARIGSATRATFSSSAVITPAATGYRFGGGGGTLRIESKLTGLNSVTVDSSSMATPLTVLLANTTNDYVGATTVARSALVFGTGALSSGSANGTFFLGSGGYIGSTDAAVTLPNWLAKFSSTATTGVLGFDSVDVNNPRTISGNFDLSLFVAGTSITLGSSSAATLSGSIVLPPLQNDYILTGYKGGWLTTDAVLTGARGVRIGSPSGEFPVFDPNDLTRMSTVFLNGSNSHSGGTTLFSGRLVIGHANALGTGVVTIDGNGSNVYPRLETLLASNPTFTNQLVVKDDFEIGGVNPFTWSGAIADGAGTGMIRKHGAFNLTLSGTNGGFSGGYYIDEGTITFTTDSAAGSGRLDLGNGSGAASFSSAAPSITGLKAQSTATRLTVGTGTLLTLNQAGDSTFRGQIQGAGGIVKTGTGTLRLESPGTYTGGTTINGGTLNAGSTGALGSNSVILNGATANLKLDSSVTLANNIVFGANGGRLSGNGTFSSNVVIGANSVIAPGNPIGTLAFTGGLTLASGGTYEFEIQDALGGPGVGWDFVQVTGASTFTATPTSPFAVNLISLGSGGASGNAANFVSTNAYSWSIASGTNFVGFNTAALAVNTASFTSALNGGTFSFSTSGNNLVLNFTPVPEPSTWALLLAGLGLVAIRKLRRR